MEYARGEKRALFIPLRYVAPLPARFLVENFLHVGFKDSFGSLAHDAGPKIKRARSRRSISKGVMHLTPRPMHALGILIFLVEAEAISWVTTV